MAEEFFAISKARAKIASLAKQAQRRMQRYVLTHQGAPQAVLLGYDDYRSLKAAADLARRPEIVENIRRGQKEIRQGKALSLDDVRSRVESELTKRQAEGTEKSREVSHS